MIFPRDKPHHSNAMIISETRRKLIYNVGNLVVESLVEESDDLFEDNHSDVWDNEKSSFRLADLDSKQMIEIATTERAYPRAHHNGLLWWDASSEPYQNLLVPTFVDLEHPQQLFYQPQRAIATSRDFPSQRTAKGLGHILISSENADGSQILADLNSGTQTLLECPCGWQRPSKLIPGFLDGQFQLRCISQDVEYEYRATI